MSLNELISRRTGNFSFPAPVTTTRRRALIKSVPSGTLVKDVWDDGLENQLLRSTTRADWSKSNVLNGTQKTVSESHPGWGAKARNSQGAPIGDAGGPFFSQKRECILLGGTQTLHGIAKVGARNTKVLYKGPFLPMGTLLSSALWPQPQASSEGQLDAYGTTAIARCKPAQPLGGLTTALIELRTEGLPKLVGAATWKAKTAMARKRAFGGEYLNVEFGWKPLINEIVGTAVTVSRSDELINQYMRDAGKQVRRRYEFPPSRVESTTVVKTDCSPWTAVSNGALYALSSINKGSVHLHRVVEKRVWFSGAFIYHLPIDFTTMEEARKRQSSLQKLLGFDLSPETLWNAAPWSWAVDWISNTGDVISNLQSWSKDGMAMRYGYVMEHVKCIDTYSFSGPTGYQSSDVRPAVVQFVVETKQRRQASPFAFGQKYGSFSNRQWAIIAALGLSRN